jgi:hypothetical protein
MTHRTKRAWLIAGALTGCALAAIQILHDVRVPVGFLPGVAARVNGRDIDRASVERTVAGFDARLLRAAISRVNSEVASQSISADAMGVFYETHRSAYASPATYEVTPLYYESPNYPNLQDARRRAAAAQASVLAGEAVETLAPRADELPFVAPGTLATARTLANYFGSSAVAALDQIRPGETTQPGVFGRGVLVLYLNRRVAGASPALPGIHDLVQADVLRERQEGALENLLQSLRKAAQIDIAPSPPAQTVPPAQAAPPP